MLRAGTRYEWAPKVALVVALAHAVAAWSLRAPGFAWGEDDAAYLLLAQELRHFSYREVQDVLAPMHARFPPLFPVLLAIVGAPFGDNLDVLIAFVALCSAGALLLFYDGTRRVLGDTVALPAALLLAINPAMLWMGGNLMAEAPFVLLTMLALWALAREDESPRFALLAGIAVYLAALTRTAGVVFVVAIFGYWVARKRYRRAALFSSVGGSDDRCVARVDLCPARSRHAAPVHRRSRAARAGRRAALRARHGGTHGTAREGDAHQLHPHRAVGPDRRGDRGGQRGVARGHARARGGGGGRAVAAMDGGDRLPRAVPAPPSCLALPGGALPDADRPAVAPDGAGRGRVGERSVCAEGERGAADRTHAPADGRSAGTRRGTRRDGSCLRPPQFDRLASLLFRTGAGSAPAGALGARLDRPRRRLLRFEGACVLRTFRSAVDQPGPGAARAARFARRVPSRSTGALRGGDAGWRVCEGAQRTARSGVPRLCRGAAVCRFVGAPARARCRRS
ncbi:MAG: glycosyltransferase family 39 protein [Gemmatimonadetes bacterium]|nr:glycosyltransferase family 39 protein [Gemmatimonadota bacterium]